MQIIRRHSATALGTVSTGTSTFMLGCAAVYQTALCAGVHSRYTDATICVHEFSRIPSLDTLRAGPRRGRPAVRNASYKVKKFIHDHSFTFSHNQSS